MRKEPSPPTALDSVPFPSVDPSAESQADIPGQLAFQGFGEPVLPPEPPAQRTIRNVVIALVLFGLGLADCPEHAGGQIETKRTMVDGVVAIESTVQESPRKPGVEAFVMVQRPGAE